jgi:hypothetical protein
MEHHVGALHRRNEPMAAPLLFFAFTAGSPLATGLALPPLSVERMRRIERHAIVVNGQAVAAFIDRPGALMAIAAERTQRPEAEGVVIAAVPWVMIGDGGCGDAAVFLA